MVHFHRAATDLYIDRKILGLRQEKVDITAFNLCIHEMGITRIFDDDVST